VEPTPGSMFPVRSGEWAPRQGDRVEIRRRGVTLRRGAVEAVMPDHSGFWIAADGIEPRSFVHLDYSDIEVWGHRP
jgi:hypothetical protein